uniref:Glycosyltransferase n=1 Tax=Panax ginseng TaxID=4054 RepID=A0A0D5ZD78_PANGI|nr:UGTPg31 [Panax ginseng]
MASSSSQLQQLHFVLIPLMSPGHLMPIVDMARLFAQHGVIVTIVSTPLNTKRFKTIVDRAIDSGLQIRIIDLYFPAAEACLPQGCENMDSISRNLIKNFFMASSMLQQPFDQLFDQLSPRPSCIISGKNQAWTVETARKFNIPRLFFDGMGCFSFSCTHNLKMSEEFQRVTSKFETFLVPGLPHEIELTKAQLPEALNPGGSGDLIDVRNKMTAAESIADGIIVNSFEELEPEYVEMYTRVKGGNIWCIGPVSASNKLILDKAERGSFAPTENEIQCLEWLHLQEPNSVVYACLGSISGLTASQLVELGLGLEASKRPFIWVIRGGERSKELERWIKQERFEERTKGRGLLVRGWAPQLLILSHSSTGGFLTHCGWNSTLEGVSAGKPIIACPLFAEQFYNEKLVVKVLGTGASVGVEAAVTWGMEDQFGLVMKRENVEKAIQEVMDKGVEAEERRKRAREFGDMAKRAIEEGGSSYLNIRSLIQHVKEKNELKHA